MPTIGIFDNTVAKNRHRSVHLGAKMHFSSLSELFSRHLACQAQADAVQAEIYAALRSKPWVDAVELPDRVVFIYRDADGAVIDLESKPLNSIERVKPVVSVMPKHIGNGFAECDDDFETKIKRDFGASLTANRED
jgi:hypothetical protein